MLVIKGTMMMMVRQEVMYLRVLIANVAIHAMRAMKSVAVRPFCLSQMLIL